MAPLIIDVTSASYNSIPVRGYVYVPDSPPPQMDLLIALHPSIDTPGTTPLTAAQNFLGVLTDLFGFEDRLVFSVAYPQDDIPAWNGNPALATQLFPGIDYANLLIGDNITYVQAAYLWATNALIGVLASNGVNASLSEVSAFGHSQGAYLVHRLNTLYALGQVAMNAPGPIDLLSRCANSEANGDNNRSCKKIRDRFGSTKQIPAAYNQRSLKSFLSGLKSVGFYTQALNDPTGVDVGLSQVQNMVDVVQPAVESCSTCLPAAFKYYRTGGHAAFLENSECRGDIKRFLVTGVVPEPSPSPVPEAPPQPPLRESDQLAGATSGGDIFKSSRNLAGQSFAHALSPFDPASVLSNEFVESESMSLFVDEKGTINTEGEIRLFKGTDPIDAETKPKFSTSNKFIQALAEVLPGVPPGGVLLYKTTGGPPGGYGLCDGSIYTGSDGKPFIAPNLSAPFGLEYIIKLPAGVTNTGGKVPPNLSIGS
jgi:hypothetical protein